MREFLRIALTRAGHTVTVVESPAAAALEYGARDFDVVITDLKMPGGSGLDVLDGVKRARPDTQVIVVTAFATTETAIAAMKRGAYDYLTKPFKVDEIGVVVERALEKRVAHPRQPRAARRAAGALPPRPPRRQVAADAAPVRAAPSRRAGQDVGAHHRRERHRQGAGGARAPPPVAARRGALRRRQLRRHPRRAARVGAVRPRQGRLHRRARRQGRALRSAPTAARCSSTRSASCRRRCR